jgi:Ion channel
MSEPVKTDELTLPIDRRSKVKEKGDILVRQVKEFKTSDFEEDEFLYEIPKLLKQQAEAFETDIKKWNRETALSSSEICVVCGVFRKARIAAESRHFRELADWLSARESTWKTKLHWSNHSYSTACVLSFVGLTTGHGTSVLRWVASIAVALVGFAVSAYPSLDYGTKCKSFANALYWSFITITTVGYGDVTPQAHTVSQIIAPIEAVIGLVMFIGLGMLIGEKVRKL